MEVHLDLHCQAGARSTLTARERTDHMGCKDTDSEGGLSKCGRVQRASSKLTLVTTCNASVSDVTRWSVQDVR